MEETMLLLVDGHNLLWRAAFGFPARIRGRSSEDVTPAFGFFALLRAGMRELSGNVSCVVCFDGEHGSARRQEILEGYKGNRQTEPVPHMIFLEPIKRGLTTCGIAWCEYDEYEADDVIGTLAARSNSGVVIMSTDRDFYQLLDDRVRVLNTQRSKGNRLVDAEHVREVFGVLPSQWCDFRALVGDASDAIRGITGVGPKTAARLLRGGYRLEELSVSDRLSGTTGRRVAEALGRLLTTREMMRLERSLPVSCIDVAPGVLLPRAADVLGMVGLL